jgi:hypothetical protein
LLLFQHVYSRKGTENHTPFAINLNLSRCEHGISLVANANDKTNLPCQQAVASNAYGFSSSAYAFVDDSGLSNGKKS